MMEKTNPRTVQFVVDNFPTMGYGKLMAITGLSLSTVKRIAYKHKSRRARNVKPSPYVEGEERTMKGYRYIMVGGRWKSYIAYVYEQENPPVRDGQGLRLVDKSMGVTIDNIEVYDRAYPDTPTEHELGFVSRCCGIAGVRYDEHFTSKRKRVFTRLKGAICALHRELYRKGAGESMRKALLGAALGRDRTMVVHYEKRHCDDYRFDPEYRKLYDKLKREYDTKEV